MTLRLSRLLAAVGAVALGTASPAFAGGCPEDVNGDGVVSFADLLDVLADWGPCPGCPTDIDGNGSVEFADLLDLLGAWGTNCPVLVSAELAGNPLTEYPFFEFVLAFNEGAPVSLAIDPIRYPDVVGQTCDIYVTADRTEAQWLDDPSLVDVRGAAQTVIFAAGTIQSDTLTLTDSAMLSGDAGIGLGVGYDIVCDLNRNGVLDTGDHVDGFGDVAGFYVVHDVTQPGPYAVTQVDYSVADGSVTPGFEQEELFYPTNAGLLGTLPLIVVSHGNGHQYDWYDHIGLHMASYGYIVMSHHNNTVPGIETASTTTLEHTDAFLGQLGTIAGGVLQGHVDSHRITWIGHSRGAEGVTRAYDRIVDGDWVPIHYSLGDIVLVSSIAPVDFLGPLSSTPHSANFSLWTGGADNDVNGCASCNLCQTFHLHERARQFRQSISLHGAGHGDFHNGGGSSVATGPCLIGRANTHDIMRGYLLPLVKHYVEGNVPARDFLWRQWEDFHPIGAPVDPCVVVDLMYRETPTGQFVIDDFETEPAADTSSSGGPVTYNVVNLTENLFDDANSDFTANGGDAMNGMTLGGDGDLTSGVVFEWTANSFFEEGIVAGQRDLSGYEYLSFRAAQATRHAYTIADLGDLTFDVTLRDANFAMSTINIGAYGGGIEEPYQRPNCGTGAGWANEFETIRIRLTDFLTNGSGLDLTNVTAIRFQFGPSHGSAVGRIGLDDVIVTHDPMPDLPGALSIDLLDPPALVPPGAPTEITVQIAASNEDLVPDTALFHYRFDAGPFESAPLVSAGGILYTATLPAALCGETPEYYFSAEGSESGAVLLPPTAPADFFTVDVGAEITTFDDDFESDLGWLAENLGATTGDWERGVPVDDPSWAYDPSSDSDGSGQCYLTDNVPGNSDVDDGAVRLTSPVLDMSIDGVVIAYDYYLNLTNSDGSDVLLVEVNSNDGVGPWTVIATHDTDGGLSWRHQEITQADLDAAGVTRTATMRLRFTANDGGDQSIVESGLDAFKISAITCE